MTWHLLVDPPASGPDNMALDESLLEAAASESLCTLRIYSWDPPTLSFGRNEPALHRYDRDAIKSRGLATVRRPTGGRAVWHDREVTYSVTAPERTFGSLNDTYHEIHAMLAEALAALGASVRLAADRPATAVGAGACFATAAGGEVVSREGAKVVGSAQVRAGGAFLQHGSILLEAEQQVVDDVTRGAADAASAAGLRSLIANGAASAESVVRAISTAAHRRWNAPGTPGRAPSLVTDRARMLRARYADDGWTWRR